MKIEVENFNLQHTLESGQFFRYTKINDWYYCNEKDKLFKIKQNGNEVEFFGTTEKHVRKLFGLDQDYDAIIKELSKDPTLKQAVHKYKGLRIMQRDPWETLVSFQCSTMSNIKKIQLNMNKLAEHFGQPIQLDDYQSFTFPKPGQINDIEKIRLSKTGFRAKYIHAGNKLVDKKYFDKLKGKTYEETVLELVKLPGVGIKVADCISLFALDKGEAFPTDVWIARVMKEKYNVEKNVKEFAAKRWGKNAGYAQQFLYHAARSNK